MTLASTRSNPYVGLPPFERDDSLFFFGRREQTIELLELLHRTHFLGLVGSSGCGKSSLVRAGLIPALLGGFLVANRDGWKVSVMKPGRAPLQNLAIALLQDEFHTPSEAEVAELLVNIEEKQVTAITDRVMPRLGKRTNLLLLVDQFEEIFAFRGEADGGDDDDANVQARRERAEHRSEADEFVALLLGLTSRTDLPIYTVLTMRSDFVGDCDVFSGLPEAMNGSRYLVPRLGREQMCQAIEGPALVKGTGIAPRLLDRLLNEVGERSDQLPVLQHALLRTWHFWTERGATGALDQADYEAAGTLSTALARHAEEAMASVNQTLAERIFKRLTDTDPQGRRVRCPAGLSELALAANASELEVLEVLEQFQASGRHFVAIEPARGRQDRRVDLSHESLIRQWTQLRTWVDQERVARDRLLELVRRSERWSRREGDLLSGVELALTTRWWGKAGPTRNWASRYCTRIEIDGAARYLSNSQHKRRRGRLLLCGAVALACAGVLNSAREAAQRSLERERHALEERVILENKLAAEKDRAAAEKGKAAAEKMALAEAKKSLEALERADRNTRELAQLEASLRKTVDHDARAALLQQIEDTRVQREIERQVVSGRLSFTTEREMRYAAQGPSACGCSPDEPLCKCKDEHPREMSTP